MYSKLCKHQLLLPMDASLRQLPVWQPATRNSRESLPVGARNCALPTSHATSAQVCVSEPLFAVSQNGEMRVSVVPKLLMPGRPPIGGTNHLFEQKSLDSNVALVSWIELTNSQGDWIVQGILTQ